MENKVDKRRKESCKGVAGKGKAGRGGGKGKVRQGRVRLTKAKLAGRGWQEVLGKGKPDTWVNLFRQSLSRGKSLRAESPHLRRL